MATKRMFSNIVIDSDDFCELSTTAQLLYFHLGMKTDDDGFVTGGKKIAKLIGATDSDLKELTEAGFLISFPDSNVYVISHFRLNNDLKNDRYHPTNYQKEYAQLEMSENKVWVKKHSPSTVETNCIHDVSMMDTEQNAAQRNLKNVTQESVGKKSGERETSEDILSALLFQAQHEGIQNLEKIKLLTVEKSINAVHQALRLWTENNKSGDIEDYLEA